MVQWYVAVTAVQKDRLRQKGTLLICIVVRTCGRAFGRETSEPDLPSPRLATEFVCVQSACEPSLHKETDCFTIWIGYC